MIKKKAHKYYKTVLKVITSILIVLVICALMYATYYYYTNYLKSNDRMITLLDKSKREIRL